MSVIPSPSRTETRPVPRGPITPNLQSSRSRLSWFRLRSQRSPAPARAVSPRTPPVYALARPRRMKRYGRRLLLWSLCFYALSALYLNALMHRWCPDLTERVHRVKWPRLRQVAAEAGDRPLILSLGSSRMDAAFQAGRFDGLPGPDGRRLAVYNFAVPAVGPLHEYLYVRDMIDAGIRPSLLVVEVLPPLFGALHRNRCIFSEEGWGVADWMSLHHFRIMHPYFRRPCFKLCQWLEGRLAPASVYGRILQAFAKRHLMPEQPSNGVPYVHDRWGCRLSFPLGSRQQEGCVLMARDYIPSLANFRLGVGPVRALHDLLKCCRREHIAVVLILMPESTEFRSWYRPDCLQAMNNVLTEVQNTTGVPVLNARLWLDDDDFIDGHHPSAKGARKFTNRLFAELALLQNQGSLTGEERPPAVEAERKGEPRADGPGAPSIFRGFTQ